LPARWSDQVTIYGLRETASFQKDPMGRRIFAYTAKTANDVLPSSRVDRAEPHPVILMRSITLVEW
jgi:hypothetical protein